MTFGGFIGLFRAEGRKGSPIVRSYLHTNGTMVIRDAPLEVLEALECVEPAFSLALLVLLLRLSPVKGENESLRLSGSHVPSLSRSFFRMCTSQLTRKADTTREEARHYLRPRPIPLSVISERFVKRGYGVFGAPISTLS